MAGITTFLDASQIPARTQDQQTFDNLMAALMQLLPKWGGEINATLGALNALAAGGVYAIPYKFSTTTTDADPGAGFLRLDNATQNAATTIRLDLVGTDTVDYTGLVDTFDASSSTIKGQIRIVKQADPSKFLDFNVTARATPTGYRNISVSLVASSSQNPFANNDPVMLFFQRTGDKGDQGSIQNFPTLYVREERASGTSGATPSATTICPLNTVKTNSITGASLSNNNVSLPVGTYEFVGTVPGVSVNNFQGQLWNNTDGTSITTGTSEYSSATANNASARSVVRGTFTLAAAKNIVLRALVPNGGSGYIGTIASTGNVETGSELWIKKVA